MTGAPSLICWFGIFLMVNLIINIINKLIIGWAEYFRVHCVYYYPQIIVTQSTERYDVFIEL